MIATEKWSALEEYVKQYISNYDCSHDWLHIERVRQTAREIALDESRSRPVDLELVDLAALLHDVGDAKYCSGDQDGRSIITSLLTSNKFEHDLVEKVCLIIENVSFRKELENIEAGRSIIYEDNIELACVQDADRLDAIGAIGVARGLAFSGARNRPIYHPDIPPIKCLTAQQYNQQTSTITGTALNHFLEKLVHLEGMMKTRMGRERAKQRTAFMNQFIAQIKSECGIGW